MKSSVSLGMAGMFKTLLGYLTRDLTGRSWVREQVHPYFGNMNYVGFKEPGKSYWEAEILLPGTLDRIGVTMPGTHEGPTREEEEFCRKSVADLDGLFEFCRAVFEPTFVAWVKKEIPADWQKAFKLDGFEIPREGRIENPWEVTYYVEPAGHSFTAMFEHGVAVRAVVDG